jgi:hypothetical protein
LVDLSAPKKPQRRDLVLVRAGKNSLHPRWLENAESRGWDLVVSVYDGAHFDHGDDIEIVHCPGGKWDGVSKYLSASNALDRYDYIWLPDDDIATDARAISAMFAEMRRWSLDIAQPSLTWDSFYTHFVTLSCPGLRLRYTNFIEIMVPFLHSRVLRAVHPDFEDSMSGFGMDAIWCRLSPDPEFKAAILDSVQMRHTRPVGGDLRKKMRETGRSAADEAARLWRAYGVEKKIRPLIYAMIAEDDALVVGKSRLGRLSLATNMCARFLRAHKARIFERSAIWRLLQLVRRQTFEPLELWRFQRRSHLDVPQ